MKQTFLIALIYFSILSTNALLATSVSESQELSLSNKTAKVVTQVHGEFDSKRFNIKLLKINGDNSHLRNYMLICDDCSSQSILWKFKDNGLRHKLVYSKDDALILLISQRLDSVTLHEVRISKKSDAMSPEVGNLKAAVSEPYKFNIDSSFDSPNYFPHKCYFGEHIYRKKGSWIISTVVETEVSGATRYNCADFWYTSSGRVKGNGYSSAEPETGEAILKRICNHNLRNFENTKLFLEAEQRKNNTSPVTYESVLSRYHEKYGKELCPIEGEYILGEPGEPVRCSIHGECYEPTQSGWVFTKNTAEKNLLGCSGLILPLNFGDGLNSGADAELTSEDTLPQNIGEQRISIKNNIRMVENAVDQVMCVSNFNRAASVSLKMVGGFLKGGSVNNLDWPGPFADKDLGLLFESQWQRPGYSALSVSVDLGEGDETIISK